MEERDIFFESINIEPSKIYTNSKFKLKIKVIGTSRILTEDNNVLNTENKTNSITNIDKYYIWDRTFGDG